MASVVFTPLKSVTDNMRFAARVSREGDGLGRKPQMSSKDMTTLSPGVPRNYPTGFDRRSPILPQDVKK